MDSRDLGGAEKDDPRSLELTKLECELLRKACLRYRAALPSYLQSKEDERALINRLLEKLS